MNLAIVKHSLSQVAYADWLERNGGKDSFLPALESFSPKQLFYLG